MMHEYKFTYEWTSGDIVMGSAEVCVKYAFKPGVPARIHFNENDHPAEGPEIEITEVLVEDWPGPIWRPATKDEFETFSEYAYETHYDNMASDALDDLSAWEDEAAEHYAGVREDMNRIFGRD